MSQSWEGGCLCGAVRFRARGAPKWTIWCHCQSCRKHSGAPAAAFAAFDESDVEVIKGEITKFNSSPGMWRGFCSTCGSTLTCQGGARPDELHIHIGAFDHPEALPPMAEFFTEERLPWVHVEITPKAS